MLGEVLSWVFSSLSNVSWLFVFIPQLIENYRKESSVAISYYLVLLLYIGDIFSIISVVSKGLSSVLIYVGVYHIIFDVVFIAQIIYYRLPLFLESQREPLLLNDSTVIYDNYNVILYAKEIFNLHEMKLLVSLHIGLAIGSIIVQFIPTFILGDFFAWSSTFIFLSSRLPQILLNYKRRSVDGLSFVTFFNIIIANQLFLASVLIPLIDIETGSSRTVYFIKNLPWILGSSLTTVFDIIMFIQFLTYKN